MYRPAVLAGGAAIVALTALMWSRRNLLVVTVEGRSMEPTLREGDKVLVRRKPVTGVRRRDVIVMTRGQPTSHGHDQHLIKRAVALPGEVVPPGFGPSSIVTPGTTIPADGLVAVGDNPEHSRDSRQTGCYRADSVVGVVVRKLATSPAAEPPPAQSRQQAQRCRERRQIGPPRHATPLTDRRQG